MAINMNMDEIWTFLLNAVLFYMAFKVGQVSAWTKIHDKDKEIIQTKLEEVRKTGIRPIITVEEINGIYYAFDGNDFLAQGATADEVGRLIAQRFPNKYQLAKVEIKA
jgi:hypothetical protein